MMTLVVIFVTVELAGPIHPASISLFIQYQASACPAA